LEFSDGFSALFLRPPRSIVDDMMSNDLTPDQARAIHERLRPMVAYLPKLTGSAAANSPTGLYTSADTGWLSRC
jgi:hypothetical protein